MVPSFNGSHGVSKSRGCSASERADVLLYPELHINDWTSRDRHCKVRAVVVSVDKSFGKSN